MEVFLGLLLVVGFYYFIIREHESNESVERNQAPFRAQPRNDEALAAVTGMAIGGTLDPLFPSAATEDEEPPAEDELFLETHASGESLEEMELCMEEMELLDDIEEFDLL